MLTNASGVTVENCYIGSLDPLSPFDFGVVTLGAKLPGEVVDDNGAMHLLRTHIQHNTIAVRYVGVLIGESDNTQVAGNEIVAMIGARSVGIDIIGDSDRNYVVGNSVTADTTADANTLVPLFPGATPSPQRPRGIRMNLGFGRVTNFCLAGELLQIPGREAALTDASLLQEDNIVESNYIDFGLTSAPFGIATAAGAVRPVIASNTITGAHQALHFSGLGPGELFGVAGHCSLDASRACGANSDCNINGCDTASKGTCVGAKTLTLGAPGVAESLGATDPFVVGNAVDGSTGKVEIGIWVAIPSPHATILQNTVSNASLAGIRINNQSLEDTTLAGNTVTGNRFGLALVVMPNIDPRSSGGFWGSKISLNDFVGSTRQAIATGVCKNVVSTSCETNADCGMGDTCLTATMPFPAELSVGGQGNTGDAAAPTAAGSAAPATRTRWDSATRVPSTSRTVTRTESRSSALSPRTRRGASEIRGGRTKRFILRNEIVSRTRLRPEGGQPEGTLERSSVAQASSGRSTYARENSGELRWTTFAWNLSEGWWTRPVLVGTR